MKKFVKLTALLFVCIGLFAVCGTMTSCGSSQEMDMGEGYMYRSPKVNKKIIKKNYKVRGNNQNNRSTYQSY